MADRSVRVRLEAITSNYDRRISESAVLTNRFARELESADGRMANMVQTALALAPALVPIGAAGIPAIAGLTAQLGFATLGVGALVLGLHGVGDALDALDKFQLEPTADHLHKLQEEMHKLGPAGGDFVLFLDHLQPRLRRLQALAEQGLLPGVEDSIENALRLMPQLRELTFNVSSTVGDLIRDAGDNLDDPRWQEFFDFLQTNARPTLTEMGQTAGNFALAFANLVEAFDPLERDFSQGLLHMSQQVREWSDGLEHTQGFRELVDYVRENGPRVLDTLGAFANAFVQIVEAGAPVGSVLLPVITEVLHVVAAIADTPAGPVIISVAAAVGTLGRSLAILKAVGLRGDGDSMIGRALGVKELKGIPDAYRKVVTATEELQLAQEAAAAAAAKARDAQFALVPDAAKRSAVYEFAAAQDRVRDAEERLATARQRHADGYRDVAFAAGKAAAFVGGIAASESGLAEKAGLANTVSLALMGTLAGPWGTALGAATGFVLDLTHANDDLEDSIKQVNAAAESGNFAQWRAALQDVLDKNKKLQADAKDMKTIFQTDPITFTKEGFGNLGKLVGINPAEDAQKEADKQAEAFAKVRRNAVDLFAVLNGANPKGLKVTDDELTSFITKISPALQRAGVDIDSLLQHRKGWLDAQIAVHAWVDEMDSAHGRSVAVGQALAALQDQITPTVDAAKQLADALDALFGPQMSQAEALDRWIGGLRDLRKELKDTGGGLSIDGVTGKALDQALKNREQIRGSVNDLLDKAKADAAAGVAPDRIARELTKGRDAIIQIAVAAGQSRPEVEKYLRRLGLTAANLNTILDQVPSKIEGISAAMRKLRDKTVTIKIRQVFDAQAHAAGGIHAPGDVANRHMPELAGPGVTRVWREPETMGEAYIPLANDFRRPRAISIWERTGQALGVQFRRYAFGGMTAATGGSAVQIDYDRLAVALSAVRPLYGDVHMQPHNYSEFQRQMRDDAAGAAIGGIPKGRP